MLPKPYSKPHPPIWVAAGNPPTFEKAARMGLGVLAFTTRAIPEMAPLIATYKDHVGAAEPVGRFVNDNVMITTGMVCAEDSAEARRRAARMGVMYLQSLVYHYHDTIPAPPGAIVWPDPVPEMTIEMVQWQIDNHYLLCGSPDEIVAQLRQWQDIGIDQLVFGVPCDLGWDETLDSLRLFGDHVIGEFDHDAVHRTTAQREAALAPSGAR